MGQKVCTITTNVAGASTARSAAAVIPYDAMGEENHIPGTSRIYVVDNGQDTAIFQFDNAYDARGDERGGGGTVTAIEPTRHLKRRGRNDLRRLWLSLTTAWQTDGALCFQFVKYGGINGARLH